MESQEPPNRKLGSKYLEKLLEGIAIGLGFSLAFGLMIFLTYLSDQSPKENSEDTQIDKQIERWNVDFLPDTKLSVKWHRARSSDYNLHILGEVKNDEAGAWESVSIEVNLFDSDDEFVWQCKGNIFSPLSPGDTHKFHVDCQGVHNDPVPDFSTYTVEVVDAHAI